MTSNLKYQFMETIRMSHCPRCRIQFLLSLRAIDGIEAWQSDSAMSYLAKRMYKTFRVNHPIRNENDLSA
jgi:hypothetical protein